MTVEEEVVQRRKEHQERREAVKQAQELWHVALERIEALETQKTPPPAFVTADVQKPVAEEKQPRKKREAQHNRARRRAMPTHMTEHHSVLCPDGDLRLGGISLARCRDVIDLPPPVPVQITEHRLLKGWCAGCQTWHEAPVDLRSEVRGQGRIGVRLASMIAYVRTSVRLPLRHLRELLRPLHGFEIRLGEIVEVLHRITTHAQPVRDALVSDIRASPAGHADETGWRDDGLNGYMWSVSTPPGRSDEYHHSRAGDVVTRVIGDAFQGVVGSDLYAGYTIHQGVHHRWWVHVLRDIHDLKKLHPDHAELWQWATQVKQISERATAAPAPDPQVPWTKQHASRVALHHAFEQERWHVCAPFAQTRTLMHTLCERVERFVPERFVFVASPGVPSDNNVAERSVRPLVIARTISGGTRSPKGRSPRMGLASLFGTWMARGLNPFHQCLAFLTSHISFGEV